MRLFHYLAGMVCVPAFIGVAASAGIEPSSAPVPAALAGCPSGVPYGSEVTKLGHLSAALASDRDVDVLAIGSAAMLGPAGLPDAAFTHRAIRLIAVAHPGIKVTLVARNARGALASEMLAVLRSELAAHRYSLVLWQAGSVEALRSVPVAAFRQTLIEGARLVAEAQGSLVLIDSQFSHLSRSMVDVGPYGSVIREIGALPGVAVFPRYDLTRAWVTSGQLDLEHAVQGDRQKAADHLNRCLGGALASLLDPGEGGARSAK